MGAGGTMPNHGVGWCTGWATLLVFAAFPPCAAADDAPPPRPAASVSPFDPSPKTPAGAGADLAPTGALKPHPLAILSRHNVSKLDLAAPSGFLPGLPPETPPPSFDPPAVVQTIGQSVGEPVGEERNFSNPPAVGTGPSDEQAPLVAPRPVMTAPAAQSSPVAAVAPGEVVPPPPPPSSPKPEV